MSDDVLPLLVTAPVALAHNDGSTGSSATYIPGLKITDVLDGTVQVIHEDCVNAVNTNTAREEVLISEENYAAYQQLVVVVISVSFQNETRSCTAVFKPCHQLDGSCFPFTLESGFHKFCFSSLS